MTEEEMKEEENEKDEILNKKALSEEKDKLYNS